MDAISAGRVSSLEARLHRFAGARALGDAVVFCHSFTSLKRRSKFLPVRVAACSLMGQLFPFSVNGATFMVVPIAISH